MTVSYISWIINGVSSQIAGSLMNTDTAYDVWTELEERYKQKNALKSNQIRYELNIPNSTI